MSLSTFNNPNEPNIHIQFLTLPVLLFLQLLLLILNGFHLCVVDLGELVPVGPVVVQAVEHGLDLLVEPGELLVAEGQEGMNECRLGGRNQGDTDSAFWMTARIWPFLSLSLCHLSQTTTSSLTTS